MNNKFEWYYFDLHNDEGYDLVFTLHSRPFMTQFAVSIFDIFLYKDNALLEHRFFTIPAGCLKEDGSETPVWFDENNYITHKQKQIIARAKGADIYLELKFTKIYDYGDFFQYDLMSHKQQGQEFIWRLFAPLCRAKAKLSIGNKTYNMQGKGYHDYNAGNFFLKKELKGWRWSKIYDQEALFIVGEIIPRQAPSHKILVVPGKQKLHHSADFYFFADTKKLTIKSAMSNFEFILEKSRQIDDIRFLASQTSGSFLYPAKIYELITAFSLQYSVLKPLSNLLTNARYVRRRLQGKTAEGGDVNVFQEEIFF